MTSVAIGIITYRRPVGLKLLLERLAAQSFQQARPEIRIVVIENEVQGPAVQVCADMQSHLPFPLQHVVETRRGIPFARNQAVSQLGTADYLAFLDDDEWPEPQWLEQLLNVQQQTGAEIVAGPVVPEYDADVPGWIVQGGFHLRRRCPSGTPLVPMGTGNVLIARGVFEKLQPAFDERFALGGGSDSHFFQRAAQAGFQAVWCDEAVVHETVPASRATTGWICRRAYRSGASFAQTQFDVHPFPSACGRVTWRVAKHLGWGLVGLPLEVIRRGRIGLVNQLSHISRASGILAGLFGRQYPEYETIHGR